MFNRLLTLRDLQYFIEETAAKECGLLEQPAIPTTRSTTTTLTVRLKDAEWGQPQHQHERQHQVQLPVSRSPSPPAAISSDASSSSPSPDSDSVTTTTTSTTTSTTRRGTTTALTKKVLRFASAHDLHQYHSLLYRLQQLDIPFVFTR
jgi:hypothetical protein